MIKKINKKMIEEITNLVSEVKINLAKEYHNLKVIRDNSFHGRYFILDKNEIYHSGASINNMGEKTFSVNKRYFYKKHNN